MKNTKIAAITLGVTPKDKTESVGSILIEQLKENFFVGSGGVFDQIYKEETSTLTPTEKLECWCVSHDRTVIFAVISNTSTPNFGRLIFIGGVPFATHWEIVEKTVIYCNDAAIYQNVCNINFF